MRSRFGSFLIGVVMGAALSWGALTHHVLRTKDGFAVAPKINPSFSETYVDIREFGASDWLEHKTLLAAIVKAKKEHLLSDSAGTSLRAQVDGFLQNLGGMIDQ